MTRPQSSELRELVERFVADRDEILRFYSVTGSALQIRRMREFYGAWRKRLDAMPYDTLGTEGRVDWLLLQRRLEHEQRLLDREESREREMAPLIPFAADIARPPGIQAPDGARRLPGGGGDARPDPEAGLGHPGRAAGGPEGRRRQGIEGGADDHHPDRGLPVGGGDRRAPGIPRRLVQVLRRLRPRLRLVGARLARQAERRAGRVREVPQGEGRRHRAGQGRAHRRRPDRPRGPRGRAGARDDRLLAGGADRDREQGIRLVRRGAEEGVEGDGIRRRLEGRDGEGEAGPPCPGEPARARPGPGARGRPLRPGPRPGHDPAPGRGFLADRDDGPRAAEGGPLLPRRPGHPGRVSHRRDGLRGQAAEPAGEQRPLREGDRLPRADPGPPPAVLLRGADRTPTASSSRRPSGSRAGRSGGSSSSGTWGGPSPRRTGWACSSGARTGARGSSSRSTSTSGKWTPEQCIDFLVDRVGHERASATGEVRRSFNGSYSPLYQAGYMLGRPAASRAARRAREAGRDDQQAVPRRDPRSGARCRSRWSAPG